MDQSDQTWETSTFCQCHNAIEVKKKVLQKTHIFYFGQFEKKGSCRQQVMQQVRGNLCTVIGPQEGGLG